MCEDMITVQLSRWLTSWPEWGKSPTIIASLSTSMGECSTAVVAPPTTLNGKWGWLWLLECNILPQSPETCGLTIVEDNVDDRVQLASTYHAAKFRQNSLKWKTSMSTMANGAPPVIPIPGWEQVLHACPW